VVVILVVVVLAVVGFVWISSVKVSLSSPSVDITGLHVVSPDNACGLNGDNYGSIEMQPPGGGIPFITWGLPGPGGKLPCTVESVSTNTLGFTLFGEFPDNVTTFPGTVVVSMIPPSSFTGILNVTFS
jgi:hypothetical protein